MSDEKKTPGQSDFWERPVARAIACAIVAIVSVVMIFGNLSGVGIWEPWEANEVLLAREYKERGEPEPTTDPLAKSWN